MSDPVIIQKATGTGSGGMATATFGAGVQAHNSVVVIIAVQDNAGNVLGDDSNYSPGFTSPGYSDDTHSLNVWELAQAWAYGTSPGAINADGKSNGSADIPVGPNISVWLAQDAPAPGFGTQVAIEGLTEIDVNYNLGMTPPEVVLAIYEIAGLDIGDTIVGAAERLGGIGVLGTTVALGSIASADVTYAPPAVQFEIAYDASNADAAFTSSSGDTVDELVAGSLSALGVFAKVVPGAVSDYAGDTITDSESSTNLLMVSMALSPPFSPAPDSAPPLRTKKLPLSLDLATCTYDQANRLLKYEIYRALGLDGSLTEPATPWVPPVTVTLVVWAESVDDAWNVLKVPDPGGVGGKPFCGRVITIDPSVSQEWAGEYELLDATYTPFQGDASGSYSVGGAGDFVRSSSSTAGSPSSNSGKLTLTLRTYQEAVLDASEVSDDPSYETVPGAEDLYPIKAIF